jgi:uncharacterized RDD family membrane protein YckC
VALAQITVLDRNNEPTGPFTVAEVQMRLQKGEFHINQLAFAEGLTEWSALSAVLAHVGGPIVLHSRKDQPPDPAPVIAQAADLPYAGFWRRFVAYLVDVLLLSVVIYGTLFALMFLVNPHGLVHDLRTGQDTAMNDAPIWLKLVIVPFFIGTPILYFALSESGSYQGTLGKRLLRLYVTDLEGRRLGFGHALGRTAAKIITNITCVAFYIGYIMVGFTARKQALHDMIAGTLVLRR